MTSYAAIFGKFLIIALFTSTWWAAGCSSSSTGDPQSPDDMQDTDIGGDNDENNTGGDQTFDALANGGSVVTTPSAQLPQVDSAGQVTWPFAPRSSGVELELMDFVEMPLADSGNPARWNDMEFTAERLFVSNEADGRIFEITGRKASMWFDVADAIQTTTGGNLNRDNPWHGGVRGFAFHPDFSSNGKFYVSMMQDRPANPSIANYLSDANAIPADSVLVEWTADPSTFAVDVNSYREVFRVGIPESDHPIKQIAFNPYAKAGEEDYGLLYVAHGDGSYEASASASGSGNNALGKILRVNPLQSGAKSFSIPPSNPFVGNAEMADTVYSLGHRNPHHLAFLPDGSLLATEAGHDNIEEVNLIEKGANYGWSNREGSFMHLDTGTLVNGIASLPNDDATQGLTYPVIQVGHTGPVNATFVGQSIGGGYMLSNGSALQGDFFYIDFVNSGRLYHSSLNSILASQTTGNPAQLTMAQTFEASIVYDHDADESTAALAYTMPELLQTTGSYDGSGRVDVRIGQGPLGEMYLMNKRNNMIYLVRNSYPPGQSIPTAPVQTSTRVNFDITVPVHQSNALQIRLVWGDKDINAIWVMDETWTISDNFPTDTEHRLVVTFNDDNGDIALGSFEQNFRTETTASSSFVISADQFDTDRWDNDGDSVSNLDELIAGTDPQVSDLVLPPTFSELQEEVFNRCSGCHDSNGSAGFNLRPKSEAYANLINQPSTHKEGAILVIPFDPDNSYLVQKMEGAEGIVGRSMSYGGPSYAQQVREWIAAGALND
ncbi:MAG: PQQ-dependent sugar dehydrogenase [Granulosicoccus sp.]